MSNPSTPPEALHVSQVESLSSWERYKKQLFLAVGVVTFLILFANFVGVTINILLLLFLCTLIALGLRGISDRLARHTPLSDKVALAVVVLALLGIIVGSGVLIGTRVAEQFSQLGETLSQSRAHLEEQLSELAWGEEVLKRLPTVSEVGQTLFSIDSDAFARITGIVSSSLSFLSSLILTIFLSIFLAAEPKTYINGFLYLIPQTKRARIREVLYDVGDALQKWLLTRLISMVVIGLVTGIGLTILGVPLALSLALIAAAGSFIPTFGPIMALIPAFLVTVLQRPEQTVLVVALYLGSQMFDNYLVSPYVQKSMLYLPPAYIIAAQIMFGVLAGSFGLLLGAPLAVVLVIVVRMLYVEDVLGERIEGHKTEGQSQTLSSVGKTET